MYKIIILIVTHVFGDFIFQGNNLSKLKSLKLPYLLEHVGIYTLILIVISPIALGLTFLQGLFFGLLNGTLHLSIDYVAGKYKVKYLEVNESKYMSVIGADYALHIIILILSYVLLFPVQFNEAIFN